MENPKPKNAELYVLATGEEADYRLQVVNSVHGADTERFLKTAGIAKGMRAADIGCGVGIISCWLAEQVGSSGEVVAVDISSNQIEQAKKRATQQGFSNISFVVANASETKLDSESFDIVFSRFVLMHTQKPVEVLLEMRRLLKPNGILAVEDGDFYSPFCYPPSKAIDRCFELYRALGALHGETFDIGRKLYQMVCNIGFESANATLAQPVFIRGDAKRLPEWTIAECAPALISAGFSTQTEIDNLTKELADFAADETTLIGMARMTQVWARR